MGMSETINELAAALAKAQGEIQGATKGSANPFFKSKYADLASVWDACRSPLSKNGLAVIQAPVTDGEKVSVETMLLHSSGQWFGTRLTATAKDDSPQAVGSTITYLRRYALQSVAGVAPEDDDAEAAQGRGQQTQHAKPVPVAPVGYHQWLSALEEVADSGMEALSSSYKQSKEEFRDFLFKHDKPKLDAMKAKAGKVMVTA